MTKLLPQGPEFKKLREQRLWLPAVIAGTALLGAGIVGIGVHNNLTEEPEHPRTTQGWELLTVDDPEYLPGDVCEVATEITDHNTDVVPDCLLLGAELVEASEAGDRILVSVTKDNEVLVEPLG